MPNTMKQLFQADENLFLDLNALDLVRFEDGSQEPTATLKFGGGGSETITGNAAVALRRQLGGLSGSEIGVNEDPQTQPSDRSAEVADQSPPQSRRNFVVPPLFLGRNKAWFYRMDEKGQAHILAFVNAKGSCSVRPFDAETGVALVKRYGSGPYEQHFADLMKGAIPLTVEIQPNLERDCKFRLPGPVFAVLREQIDEIV
jgi:hypothetical protein